MAYEIFPVANRIVYKKKGLLKHFFRNKSVVVYHGQYLDSTGRFVKCSLTHK